MRNHGIKHKRKLMIVLALMLALCMALVGCLEEEGNLWDNEELLEATKGENWWDHPGQGGTSDDDWEDDDWLEDDWDDEDWSEDDWGYEDDIEWWNVLDSSWSRSDWEPMGDGVWMILDEETMCVYLYDEEYQQFGAMDLETEEPYILDMETGEWILME